MPIEHLQEELTRLSDGKTKDWWEAYLKHSLNFRGLKLPQVRAIVHTWMEAEKFSSQLPSQQLDTALALIREPWEKIN